MKLSQKDREELRQRIADKITDSEIPSPKKLNLSKDLLEMLLFETCETKEGESYKFLVWTGPFLEKIDLKGISFARVVWHPSTDTFNKFKLTAEKREYLEYVYVRNVNNNDYHIYLANTNVRLNFLTSYEKNTPA